MKPEKIVKFSQEIGACIHPEILDEIKDLVIKSLEKHREDDTIAENSLLLLFIEGLDNPI